MIVTHAWAPIPRPSTYNRQSQRTSFTDQNGSVHEYDYDDLGRMTDDRVTTLATGVDATVLRLQTQYDVRGLVTKLTSYEDASPSLFNVRNEVEFTYNDFGQSIKTYQAHGGAVNTSSTPNVQMGYTDGTSNRVRPTSLTYPNGRQVVFQYGPSAEIDAKASRIRNLRDSGVDLVQYAYLGENSVVQQTSPEADLEQTLISLTGSDDPDTGDIYAGLDRFGRIKDLRWRNTSSSTDLARREYGYDRDSNRLWSTDPVDTNSEHDWLLSYDGLQRLKDAERGELNGTHSAISTLDFSQCWTLDATNNWQNFRQNDDGSGGWDLEQARTANKVNEITDITNSTGPTAITPTYDANGNMVTDRSGNHLLYDAWNRLMRVGDPSNALLQRNDYDARGFLVRKRNYSGGVVSERFENYYTDSWQLIEVRPGTSATVSEQNVWGLRYIDDLVLRDRDTTGNGTLDERLYCAQDANWNAIAVVDTSGAVQERYSYTPYGEVTFLSPSYATRSSSDYAWTTLFTGRAWDPVSGFYHFRRREYDPALGVFITRDPLGYADGSGLYVPYFVPNGVDPLGLQGDPWSDPWRGGHYGGPTYYPPAFAPGQPNSGDSSAPTSYHQHVTGEAWTDGHVYKLRYSFDYSINCEDGESTFTGPQNVEVDAIGRFESFGALIIGRENAFSIVPRVVTTATNECPCGGAELTVEFTLVAKYKNWYGAGITLGPFDFGHIGYETTTSLGSQVIHSKTFDCCK